MGRIWGEEIGMNYQKIHDNIIERAIDRDWYSKSWKIGSVNVDHYKEVHHIIPISVGGSHKKSNLVVLTMKEHFLIHYLLTKLHPEVDSLILAFSIMCNRTDGKSGKHYQILKENMYRIQSEISSKHWTDEKRGVYKEIMINRNSDLEYQKKIKEGIDYAIKHRRLRERQSENSYEVWGREGFRESHKLAMKDRVDYMRSDEGRREVGDRVRKENKENPELAKKRLAAIENHMYNKSEEWKIKVGAITKKRMNTKENNEKYSKLLLEKDHPMNRSREVYNKETGEVFRSIKYAAEILNINYNTLKKWFYDNNEKCPIKEVNNENK